MPNITKLSQKEIKRLWIMRNPGILARIAESFSPPVTRSAVQAVFMYSLRSKDFRIERALAEAGAPFMRELYESRISGGCSDEAYREMTRRRKSA